MIKLTVTGDHLRKSIADCFSGKTSFTIVFSEDDLIKISTNYGEIILDERVEFSIEKKDNE
jgi:hypothetical protein